MMSLTERINLLNKSNSDSSNKENIEDYANGHHNRSLDIFDGSLEQSAGGIGGRKNSSIRKLKNQFEVQQPELGAERFAKITARVSVTRQYSEENKLVKTKIKSFCEQEQVEKKPEAVVKRNDSVKSVDKPVIASNLLKLFTGNRSDEIEDCPMAKTPKNAKSADICNDFERVYNGGWMDSVESSFNYIYSRLSRKDRLNVDERFEEIYKTVDLGMIYIFNSSSSS